MHNYDGKPSNNEIPQSTPPLQHLPPIDLGQELSQYHTASNGISNSDNRLPSVVDFTLGTSLDSSLSIQENLLPDSMNWQETLNSREHYTSGLDLFGSIDTFESPDLDQQSLPPVSIDPSMTQSRSILSYPGSPLLQNAPSNHPVRKHTSERDLEMSEVCWDAIRTAVANWSPLFALPKRAILSRFIRRYFASFHRHQPLLHEPTWSPNNSPLPLILAVCANGALYSLERTAAMEMHRIAIAMLEEACDSLPTLQAMMLLGAFSAWCDPIAHFDTALKLHGQMAISVRKAWAAAAEHDGRPDDALAWEHWLERESRKRLEDGVWR